MIFADFGEGRAAPGVAPGNAITRRQANGLPMYGTAPGLLPALPPNFGAVNISSGDVPTAPSGGSGGGGAMRVPGGIVVPTKSTTLPSTVASFVGLSTKLSPGLQPSTYPSYQTAPPPTPSGPDAYAVGPSFTSQIGPDIDAAAQAAAAAAAAAGHAAAQGSRSSKTPWIVGGVAAVAAVIGLGIVLKHR